MAKTTDPGHDADTVRLLLLLHLVRALFADRTKPALENLALRQQVAVPEAKGPFPQLSVADRAFWTWLRRGWTGWSETLLIVQPDTVVRSHREGFRLWGAGGLVGAAAAGLASIPSCGGTSQRWP